MCRSPHRSHPRSKHRSKEHEKQAETHESPGRKIAVGKDAAGRITESGSETGLEDEREHRPAEAGKQLLPECRGAKPSNAGYGNCSYEERPGQHADKVCMPFSRHRHNEEPPQRSVDRFHCCDQEPYRCRSLPVHRRVSGYGPVFSMCFPTGGAPLRHARQKQNHLFSERVLCYPLSRHVSLAPGNQVLDGKHRKIVQLRKGNRLFEI